LGWFAGCIHIRREISRDFIEADGDGLAEVHRRLRFAGVDDGDGVAPGEIVAGEAVFFRTEDEGNVVWFLVGVLLDQGFANFRSGFGEIQNFLYRPAAVERAGAENQGAVSHGFGESFIDFGLAEQIGSADGRLGFHPVLSVGGDDAQMMKAEVGHGARRRADVQRVAWGDEDDVDSGGLVGWDQDKILAWTGLPLPGQLGFEGLLAIGDEAPVAGGVQKWIAGRGDRASAFGCLQAVVFG